MMSMLDDRSGTRAFPVVDPPARLAELDWLVLDLENILFDATAWWEWMVQQLGRLGLHTESDLLWRVWEQDFLRAVQYGGAEFWPQFSRFLVTLGLSRGQINEVIVAARPRQQHLWELCRPVPLLARTLQDLKRRRWRLALGASTAMHRAEVQAILDRLRVRQYFEETLLSLEVGPEGWADGMAVRMAQQLGVPVNDVAYVGCSPGELLGARVAGAVTIGFATAAAVPVAWRIGHFEHLARIPSWQPLRQAS